MTIQLTQQANIHSLWVGNTLPFSKEAAFLSPVFICAAPRSTWYVTCYLFSYVGLRSTAISLKNSFLCCHLPVYLSADSRLGWARSEPLHWARTAQLRYWGRGSLEGHWPQSSQNVSLISRKGEEGKYFLWVFFVCLYLYILAPEKAGKEQ